MTIKRCSTNVESDKKLQYKLTKSPDVQKLQDAIDTTISVTAYCVYDDSEEDEKEKIIITLLGDNGAVYGSNSKTALSNFNDITEFFEDDIVNGGMKVAVKSSVSKNGREFIMLEYAA